MQLYHHFELHIDVMNLEFIFSHRYHTLHAHASNGWKSFQACLDHICGDKCLVLDDYTSDKCECGDTTFDIGDAMYCCITRNETCKTQGLLCKPMRDID